MGVIRSSRDAAENGSEEARGRSNLMHFQVLSYLLVSGVGEFTAFLVPQH